MRFIKKLNTPQFFIDDTNGLVEWDDYGKTYELREKKRKLNEYILKEEQNYLCIYCEDKIITHKDISHLEHIKPKHKYINLTFDYRNLAVSCNGMCRNDENDNTNHNCGHRKDKDDTPFKEDKFLNPTKVEEIREYFEYDRDSKIIPSEKDFDKAKYMIDTLHLNDGDLPSAREKALRDFELINNEMYDLESIRDLLNSENLAFISFLRYRYKHIL